MITTLSTAENALKSVYLGAVSELLNTQVNPLMTKIRQSSTDIWGKDIRKAVTVGLNGGVGAGDENGELPTAYGNNYMQFVASLKNLYGQIEISDKAIQSSASNKGAFTDLLNAELDGLLKASRFNLGRMLYSDGSGKLAAVKVAGTTTTNTLVVDDTRLLTVGMGVDIISDASGTITDVSRGNRIVNIDKSAKSVTLLNAVTNAATTWGIYVQNSRGKEITGLGAIFDTAKPLYGIDRTTTDALTPYIKKSVGALNELVIQQAIDAVEAKAGNTINFIAVSADVKYAYMNYMNEFKRNIDIMSLEGGYKTMSFNGIPMVYDKFIPSGTMYLLDTDDFCLHQLSDWRFLETENGKILRQKEGYAAYSATLVKYCELICDRPAGQGMLTGITG